MAESSFNWRLYLKKNQFSSALVSSFKHVAFHTSWDNVTKDVRVEVRSPDCKSCCTDTPCRYWIATVVKTAGYWGLLHYVGSDSKSEDKWVNLLTEPHIHPIGWCSENSKHLVPPKSFEDRCGVQYCKDLLEGLLIGASTIPPDFNASIEQNATIGIRKGMKLEVVDKNMISVVRQALVDEVVGGRLLVKYVEPETEDEGFWVHERSPLVHPVGWAQVMNHPLKARPEYARQSLKKVLELKFQPDDANWGVFLPFLPHYKPPGKFRFKEGMKLEAIDPLNLSTICVATVTQVLRNYYLMIGIDGMMDANGSDWFCYHASSPSIFPVGFCESHGLKLTPPRGYEGDFVWSEYLKKTKAEAAPSPLFHTHKKTPKHGFKEGMYLEAVDLMEPRLICVAYVTKVVGRLLRIHFEGWEDDYDQWCDCESPDLFPIGWCEIVNYKLEAPRADDTEDRKKKPKVKKRYKRKSKFRKTDDSCDQSSSKGSSLESSK